MEAQLTASLSKELSVHDEWWSPMDILGKIFPGISHHRADDHCHQRRRNHNSCAVTLYYDGDKNVTVGVLSRRLDCLDVYFQCRVQQCTALQRSPLYYELDGYVRENLCRIRRHAGFSPQSVVVALGAMASSDDAQKAELAEARSLRLQIHHAGLRPDNETLERVLDIARLQRLGDDLDVLSIYFMRLSSKTLGKVAARMARTKMENACLVLSPYVDGTLMSGDSEFIRADRSQLVRLSEFGRIVEYQKCKDIQVVATGHGVFAPSPETKPFSWKCEEIALENLRHWRVVRDYVGHKIVLRWVPDPGSADFLCFDEGGSVLKSFRLEADPVIGHQTRQESLTKLSIIVKESECYVMDDVTTTYAGLAVVEKVCVDFLCLVRASARANLENARAVYKQFELERPLLDHEVDYLTQIEEAAMY